MRGHKLLELDESAYRIAHKYAVFVCDLCRSCVVWGVKGKGLETIERPFNENSEGRCFIIELWGGCIGTSFVRDCIFSGIACTAGRYLL